jgi:AraC family transcriptional regulator
VAYDLFPHSDISDKKHGAPQVDSMEKLPSGCLHGRVIKSLDVSGFVLTETAHRPRTRLPQHAHENAYFCFVLQGIYTEYYGTKEVTCKPSALTFRGSGVTHEDVLHEADCRVFVLEIPQRWIERLRDETSLVLKNTLEFFGGTLPQLFARLNREFHKTDSAARLAIEGLALEILAEAVRQSSTRLLRTTPPWLKQAREMIVEHFRETLTLAQIAAYVGVHPVHLATTFRQKYGVTIGECVRKLRIEHACAELKGTIPLAAIALQAGFADQSHFSKVFKSHVGTTPARYRTNCSRLLN